MRVLLATMVLGLGWLPARGPGQPGSASVSVYTTTITIPTYPFAAFLEMHYSTTYNIHYPWLNRSAYEASGPSPAPRDYVAVIAENDWLRLTFLPELGGRLYGVEVRSTGEQLLYQNPVIKPTGWGQSEQNWWLAAGGIEWCLPVEEHGYEWGIPWDWDAVTSTGGITLTLRDSEAGDRLRAIVTLFLPADQAHLAVTPRIENPTDHTISYKFWDNAALAPGAANSPGADLRFFFNATQMRVHSTADARLPEAGGVFNWPVHNGVDYSRLGNWTGWLGFFEYPQAASDFVALYSESAGVGVVRAFPHTVARGAKGFATGWSEALPPSLWTDDDSGGVEIHGGVAPTFWDQAVLGRETAIEWTEFWYPLHDAGGLSAATAEGTLYLSGEDDRAYIEIHTTAPHPIGATQLTLWDAPTCTAIERRDLPALAPFMPFTLSVPLNGRSLAQLSLVWSDAGQHVLSAVNDVGCLNVATPEPHLGYGINVRDPDRIPPLIPPLSLEWIKLWEEYLPSPPAEPLPYKVLYLINCSGQDIGDLDVWGEHVAQIARAGAGVVAAYEICNEPNVRGFWAGQPPDPQRFAEMLCVARQRIKAEDPDAVVVSGGLAPVGRIPGTCDGWDGNDCAAMDERKYLQAMLDYGAGDCMDAFGYHPYGFASSPEQDAQAVPNGFAFRGVEALRATLVSRGRAILPVWATEFNWFRRPADDGVDCNADPDYLEHFKWQEVGAQAQADYLARAFQYADTHWPWMHGMFVWNLDWYNYLPEFPCLHSRFYSLRRYDDSDLGLSTPAYLALAALNKRPGLTLEPRLVVLPEAQTLLVDLDAPDVVTATFAITNTGYGGFTWTATLMPDSTFTPTLPLTQGVPGQSLWVVVNPEDLRIAQSPGTTMLFGGTFTATLSISTVPTDVLNAPTRVTVVVIASPVARIYLPLALRAYSASSSYTYDTPRGPSKIGIHAIVNDGTTDFVAAVHAAGAHVAVVKGLDFGFLREVKEISPETVTIGRWQSPEWEGIETEGDPQIAAAAYMEAHMAHWELHKAYVDYWEVLNEPDPPSVAGHAWLAEFFIAAMDIAEENGYRLALFSYSVGVPEFYEWEAIAETGVFARAQQGGHILSLHEYADPMDARWGEALPRYPGQDPNDPSLPRYADRGVLTGRYRHLYRDILIPRGQVIPLVITECNLAIDDPVARGEIFVEQMRWYDDRLREDAYVLGMTIFTLGDYGWDHFNYHEFLPELAERIVALKDE
ncbi:MAG: DUF5107 domain-containing protein [Anaerolineae bacterium]|nr:DUF5107 domain-containing protein [Anaerolineae bacterium]